MLCPDRGSSDAVTLIRRVSNSPAFRRRGRLTLHLRRSQAPGMDVTPEGDGTVPGPDEGAVSGLVAGSACDSRLRVMIG